ncbi:YdcF family protein [Pelatocladus sp. BLCC-F211]|uniref:YdcF family protein n=1 Tax=Pelatocladus sp. BLCC-F211 TaxID=3342752 RepID=UPI0035B798CA
MKRLHPQLKKYWILAFIGFSLTLFSIIPIRLAIASYQAPQPQAILMLGGTSLGERETFTAEFAQWYPSLEIWVSSPNINPNKAHQIFRDANIPDQRVYLDYRATDTVTNFTTLISDFQKHRIQHLFLITSDYHMPRAKAIATIILGSQGIAFTPLSVPSNQQKEPIFPILRDIGRSFFWMITGYTGASLKSDVVRY